MQSWRLELGSNAASCPAENNCPAHGYPGAGARKCSDVRRRIGDQGAGIVPLAPWFFIDCRCRVKQKNTLSRINLGSLNCLVLTKRTQVVVAPQRFLKVSPYTEWRKHRGQSKKAIPNTSINLSSIYLKFSINALILKELVDDALYSGSSKKESNNAFFIFSSNSESELNGTSFKINTFLYKAAKIIAIEV